MAIIESITTQLVDLPTIRPHVLAMAALERRTLAIVRLRCSDGVEGVGEATSIGGLSYGGQSPEGVKLHIDSFMRPLLLNQRATNVHGAMALLDSHVQGNSFAKAAIETALLDAHGKRCGVSIADLLGGAVRNALPVLWTLASGDTGKDIEEAEALLSARRHRVFKLKLGRGALKEDLAHALEIQRALGGRAQIIVDVNQRWEEAEAAHGIAVLEAAGVALIEQPISRHNRAGMARLAARFVVPLMADEAFDGPEDAFELARQGAADVFSLKVLKAGGLYSVMRAAAVGDAAGVALYGGTMLEGTIGTLAGAHVFRTLPRLSWGTELFGPLLLQEDIVTEKPQYRDFKLEVPQGPGLGVTLDEDKLQFYSRDRQR
jgi:muconate cycloisomerase